MLVFIVGFGCGWFLQGVISKWMLGELIRRGRLKVVGNE